MDIKVNNRQVTRGEEEATTSSKLPTSLTRPAMPAVLSMTMDVQNPSRLQLHPTMEVTRSSYRSSIRRPSWPLQSNKIQRSTISSQVLLAILDRPGRVLPHQSMTLTTLTLDLSGAPLHRSSLHHLDLDLDLETNHLLHILLTISRPRAFPITCTSP